MAPDGTILATARRATPGASVSDTEDAITAVAEELAAGHDGELVGAGIGAAGWFDRTGDTVLFSPHLAWRHASLRKDLAARLQRPLWVGNDADAAAWAEYRYGAARGADLALMITLGTGIGGGIVMDGRLQRGSHGVAGEWGHMRVVPDGRLCACGNRGCWEQYASGSALGQTAREVAGTSPAAAAMLLERVDGAGVPADRRGRRPRGPRRGPAGARAGHRGRGVARSGDRRPRRRPRPRGRRHRRGRERAGRDGPRAGARPARAGAAGRGFRPGPRIVAAELGAQAGMVGAADLVRRAVAEGEA